jgi:hypothetical protein
MLGSAADQARRLNHGWVGTEHYLLALLAEPSVATEALAELGVTYDRLDDQLRSQQEEPGWAPPRYEPAKGLSPNPAAYKLEARAEGLGLAWGHRWPEPEHFLLAMVYEDDGLVPGCTLWAPRRRRSWRRCGGAGFACPRWNRPPTGRGAASTASRSPRRSCSPCSTCSSGSTHQGRSGAGASTGCRASHAARGWTPRRASTWARSWRRHGGEQAPEPLTPGS